LKWEKKQKPELPDGKDTAVSKAQALLAKRAIAMFFAKDIVNALMLRF